MCKFAHFICNKEEVVLFIFMVHNKDGRVTKVACSGTFISGA